MKTKNEYWENDDDKLRSFSTGKGSCNELEFFLLRMLKMYDYSAKLNYLYFCRKTHKNMENRQGHEPDSDSH